MYYYSLFPFSLSSNISYVYPLNYSEVPISKCRDYPYTKFPFVRGSYFRIILSDNEGDETKPIYYDITDLESCEDTTYLAVLYRAKGSAVLDIVYFNAFVYEQSQTY